MRLGMHQLVQRDLQQIAHWQIGQWPRQQPVDRGIDIAEMTQRAVGDVLHRAALLRAQRGVLPPYGGEFGVETAAGEYAADNMCSEALGAFHIQGILCGLDIQTLARLKGCASKK